jgi:signal peptidase I
MHGKRKVSGQKQGKTAKHDTKIAVKRESAVQFSISMICTLVVGLFILTFNVQAFEIPTGSMEPTLLVGDHLFVDRSDVEPQARSSRLLPHHTIKQGDILVFLSPAQPELHLVKRVIGIPGDRLRLKGGVLIRNGHVVKEPYVIRNGTYVRYRDDFPTVVPSEAEGLSPRWQAELGSHIHDGDIVVPPGNYFAMGDNRDNSYDSRYWGFVPEDNIIGRPLIIYWSFEDSPDDYLKTSPSERLAHASRVVLHFLDETRWRRMLTTPR